MIALSRRGHTLPELAVATMLVAVGIGLAVPRARAVLDRSAVSSARARASALFVRARWEAVARGGATVVVDPGGDRLWIEGRDGWRSPPVDPRGEGVELTVRGREGIARLRYDPLGIGRAASRTLLLRRGGIEGEVVVSAYGRVRIR